jgi:hypothetical protein
MPPFMANRSDLPLASRSAASAAKARVARSSTNPEKGIEKIEPTSEIEDRPGRRYLIAFKDRRYRALFKIHKFKIREDGLPSGSVVHENTLVLLRDDIRKAGVRIVKSKKTSSRRDVLRKAVLSALLSAAPLSVLGAATHNGAPTAITLNDGSRLIITKVADKQYTATRAEGDKVVDERPTGSFNAKNGQVIVLDQGKVKSVRSKTGARADWFLAFSS